MKLFLLAICGVMGVFARYFLESAIGQQQGQFPVGTFIVNIIGCFILGCLYSVSITKISHPLTFPLMVGFCGGFTTFSSYALQGFLLMSDQQFFKSFMYLFLSPVVGILLLTSGFQLTQIITK